MIFQTNFTHFRVLSVISNLSLLIFLHCDVNNNINVLMGKKMIDLNFEAIFANFQFLAF